MVVRRVRQIARVTNGRSALQVARRCRQRWPHVAHTHHAIRAGSPDAAAMQRRIEAIGQKRQRLIRHRKLDA
jgi:histidinol-phosphate/aromatic aminotransferase/cobyric acid decarboxylase-like protein